MDRSIDHGEPTQMKILLRATLLSSWEKARKHPGVLRRLYREYFDRAALLKCCCRWTRDAYTDVNLVHLLRETLQLIAQFIAEWKQRIRNLERQLASLSYLTKRSRYREHRDETRGIMDLYWRLKNGLEPRLAVLLYLGRLD
ncbi:MAG: hypothetical protein WCC94_00765 [Candidatus Bathyarchaeia archaeon]